MRNPQRRQSDKVVTNHGAAPTTDNGGTTTVPFNYAGTGATAVSAVSGRAGVPPAGTVGELIRIEENGDPTETNDTAPDDQVDESISAARYFVHQNRSWNVIALTGYAAAGSNNGRIVERYSYRPHGGFVLLAGDSGSAELGSARLTSSIGPVRACRPPEATDIDLQERRGRIETPSEIADRCIRLKRVGHPGTLAA
ncbi:MAG: hypothetical protein IH986_02000 [Planctomycetes bacterium]|nr:hypothetical protein [Planctomycetota bacterium]